jgi:hypothetical protein
VYPWGATRLYFCTAVWLATGQLLPLPCPERASDTQDAHRRPPPHARVAYAVSAVGALGGRPWYSGGACTTAAAAAAASPAPKAPGVPAPAPTESLRLRPRPAPPVLGVAPSAPEPMPLAPPLLAPAVL